MVDAAKAEAAKGEQTVATTPPAPLDDTRKIELCAMAAQEVNRIYCLAVGDTSQPHWDDAPDWQKSSALLGVQGALAGNTPEQSHIGWMKVKREDGWVYGEVKDPVAKTHPAFLDYADLPEAQKMKDELFLDTVRSMAAVLGLPMKPRDEVVGASHHAIDLA